MSIADMAEAPTHPAEKEAVYRIKTDDIDKLIDSRLKLLNYDKADAKKKVESLQNQVKVQESMSYISSEYLLSYISSEYLLNLHQSTLHDIEEWQMQCMLGRCLEILLVTNII